MSGKEWLKYEKQAVKHKVIHEWSMTIFKQHSMKRMEICLGFQQWSSIRPYSKLRFPIGAKNKSKELAQHSWMLANTFVWNYQIHLWKFLALFPVAKSREKPRFLWEFCKRTRKWNLKLPPSYIVLPEDCVGVFFARDNMHLPICPLCLLGMKYD